MSATDLPVYRDPTQPIDARVQDLLGRMTLEEKAAQTATFSVGAGAGGPLNRISPQEMRAFMRRMGAAADVDFAARPRRPSLVDADGRLDVELATAQLIESLGGLAPNAVAATPRGNAEVANGLQRIAVQETRLGIPILFVGEGLHGHVAAGATIFPQAIGMASTWNPALIERIGRAIGTEARAVGTGELFAPVLDLGRDPRWGRTEETYGEDPHLASRLGVAMVKGMQGKRLSDRDAVAGGGKHFGGHGEPLGGRDSNMEGMTERDLREIHLRTFEAAVKEAGARSIMIAYHALDGVPCHANRWLLTELLRQEWGYKGHVLSDAGGVEGLHTKHRVAADVPEAVQLALEAGMDTFLTLGATLTQTVVDIVRQERLAESTLDQAVSWILRLKFELGLFENPYVDPDRAEALCNAPEHRALALQAARESIVLLKNDDGLLPLARNVRSILVAGPNANSPYNQLGCNSGEAPVVTLLEGIRAKVGDATHVRYARGCGIKDGATDGIPEAVQAAIESDLVILALGESSWTEGMTSGEGNDRDELNLPGAQQQLLQAVHATGTPIILVLINGRPLSINWAAEHVPAILEAWYPGQEGGTAIADVLWGDSNPSGKLPITIPQSVGQVPLYYNYKPTGRAYDYVLTSSAPLYPFGYGLSYTQFAYSDLAITPDTIGVAGEVTVSVRVQNVGDRAGDEVVQLYVNDVISSVVTPVIELKGFRRIALAAGECQVVSFTLGPSDLALLDRHLEPVVEPGEFEVKVGGLKGSFVVR